MQNVAGKTIILLSVYRVPKNDIRNGYARIINIGISLKVVSSFMETGAYIDLATTVRTNIVAGVLTGVQTEEKTLIIYITS